MTTKRKPEQKVIFNVLELNAGVLTAIQDDSCLQMRGLRQWSPLEYYVSAICFVDRWLFLLDWATSSSSFFAWGLWYDVITISYMMGVCLSLVNDDKRWSFSAVPSECSFQSSDIFSYYSQSLLHTGTQSNARHLASIRASLRLL